MESSKDYLEIEKLVKELTAEKQKLTSKIEGLELENNHLIREQRYQEPTYRNCSQEYDYLMGVKEMDEFQRQEFERLLKVEGEGLQFLTSMVSTYNETLLELENEVNDVKRWIEMIETIQEEMDFALYVCDQDHGIIQSYAHQQLQIQREVGNKMQMLRKDIEIVSNNVKSLQKIELGSKKSIVEVKAKLQKVAERKVLEKEIILKVKNVKSSIREIVDELTVKVQDQEKKATEEKQELGTRIEKLNSRIHELQIEIFTENLSSHNNEKKVMSSKMELANLQQKMMKLQVEIEKNNSNLLIEKEDLLCKINALEINKQETESKFTKQIDDFKEDEAAQEVLKVQLQKSVDENKVKIDEQQGQLQLSEEKVIAEKNEKDELNRQYLELEANFSIKNEEMYRQIKELESNLANTETEQEEEETTLKLEMEELKTWSDELQNTVVELTEKLEILNLESQKYKELVSVPIDDFQKDIEQAENDVQLQIEEIKSKGQELESAMIQRELEFLQKKEQLISNLENVKAKKDVVQKSIAELKEKLEHLNSELERCQQAKIEANFEKEAVEIEYAQNDDAEMESLPTELENELSAAELESKNLTETSHELTKQFESLEVEKQELLEKNKNHVKEVEIQRLKLLEREKDLENEKQKYNEFLDSTENCKQEFKFDMKQKENYLIEVELAMKELNEFMAEQAKIVNEHQTASEAVFAQLNRKIEEIRQKTHFLERKKSGLEISIKECVKEIQELELLYQDEKRLQLIQMVKTIHE